MYDIALAGRRRSQSPRKNSGRFELPTPRHNVCAPSCCGYLRDHDAVDEVAAFILFFFFFFSTKFNNIQKKKSSTASVRIVVVVLLLLLQVAATVEVELQSCYNPLTTTPFPIIAVTMMKQLLQPSTSNYEVPSSFRSTFDYLFVLQALFLI